MSAAGGRRYQTLRPDSTFDTVVYPSGFVVALRDASPMLEGASAPDATGGYRLSRCGRVEPITSRRSEADGQLVVEG